MPTDAEIETKFWNELKSSPFVMLGLDGERNGATQPMTAHFEGEAGPLWFFTATDHDIVQALARSDRAIATYAAKGHDLFASITGTLTLDNDRAAIDRLWNPIAPSGMKAEEPIPSSRCFASTLIVQRSGSATLAG